MKSNPRPSYRVPFRRATRSLHVYLYTSNVQKYTHLKTLFDRFGLPLRYFKSHTDPYPEDYSGTTDDLLHGAWTSVRRTIGEDRLFLLEDTTIDIPALSRGGKAFPGLRAKEWFDRTSFDELDRRLGSRGGDRTAIVRSDIALNLPGLARPLLFHGETKGRVASEAPDFRGSPVYPWLTPATFNGWFVPEGAHTVLGNLTFEESLPYDFRLKAVTQLIDRLEELTCALNLPPNAYGVVQKRVVGGSQLPLLGSGLPQKTFVVVGKTCAGKTTLGDYAAQQYDFRFIEASSVVRSLWPGTGKLRDFAQRLLDESGADFVAREIIDGYGDELIGPTVISGFRTIEEIEAVKQALPVTSLVLVESAERTRFSRNLKRGRDVLIESFEDFVAEDIAQWRFGLLRAAGDLADIVISNEGTMEEFHAQIDAVLQGKLKHPGVVYRRSLPNPVRGELFRCLRVLAEHNRPLNTAEIAHAVSTHGQPIRANNVNKCLKAAPELARRLERGSRIRYGITEAGRAFVRILHDAAI